MTYLRSKLDLFSTYVAKGLGFGLGVACILELFDLRVVLLLQTGAGF